MSLANTILDFQPAVGVEIAITTVTIVGQTAAVVRPHDGTNSSEFSNNAPNDMGNARMKWFINNTIRLRISAIGAGQFSTYAGIQTQ